MRNKLWNGEEYRRKTLGEKLHPGRYNGKTNEDIVVRRNGCALSHDEAAPTSVLPSSEGLALRVAMAGQCENDQFGSVDIDGKPLW